MEGFNGFGLNLGRLAGCPVPGPIVLRGKIGWHARRGRPCVAGRVNALPVLGTRLENFPLSGSPQARTNRS
jgi:hypothetical protein